MSRQQFLAELNQYLTFVSPEQRSEIIAYYGDMLEKAGPDGEPEVLSEIGTPMTVAITLKRRLEAGEQLIPKGETKTAPPLVKFDPDTGKILPEAPMPEPPAADGPPPVYERPEPAKPAAPVPSGTGEPASPEAGVPAAEDVPAAETVPETSGTDADNVAAEPEAEADIPAPETAPEPPKALKSPEASEAPEKKKVTFGRVLGAIGIALISVIIVVFFTGIAAVGGVIGESSVEIIISGIAAMGLLEDALMIFAGGGLAFAAALLIVWFAVWAAIRLIVGMIRRFNGLQTPERPKTRTVWNIVLIIVLILVVLGVICGAVSVFMDGNIDVLLSNEAFCKMLSRLDPFDILSFIECLPAYIG